MMEKIKNKDLLLREALLHIPRILQMCDRNPLSPTYGSFDRSFWHYKTADFPSGMYQENVLPLALVYHYSFPGNLWFRQARVKELCCAGIYYGCLSAHHDGSCDDYYPNEKAFGATSFSLYAATESYLILQLNDQKIIDFFKKRGKFLISNNESGRLSNHQALAALALYNIFLITGDQRYENAAKMKVEQVLSWQDSEGWFYEYEGCDPGYLTATISFLSKYFKKSSAGNLIDPLVKAINFAHYFIHPDGSYGGEYGSRNTYHFYPHGFEVMASYAPIGKKINDLYLAGISCGKKHCNDDDRLYCHSVYDFLQAWLDYCPDRVTSDEQEMGSCLQAQLKSESFAVYYPNSGFFLYKNKSYSIVINLLKGGVAKAHNSSRAFVSDTGVTLKDENGQMASTAIFLKDRLDLTITRHSDLAHDLFVSGHFYRIFVKTSSPIKQMIFRLINLSLGKISSSLMRKVLQKIIILNKSKYYLRYERTISLREDIISIKDKLIPSSKLSLEKVAIGSDQTGIYTAAANSYQESVLLSWHYLSQEEVGRLNAGEVVELERKFFC